MMIYRLRDSNDGRRTIAFAVKVCMAVRETGRNEAERSMDVVYFIFAEPDAFHYTKGKQLQGYAKCGQWASQI